jgi:dolichol-phosphate mannosyltransferase
MHFWLSIVTPASEDEFYYWAWSQFLSPSYYDHPPLIALLIKISTAIFGDNVFGIRFFAVVSSSLVLLLTSTCCRNPAYLFPLLFTPVFFWGGILMTPDAPFLFFWFCYAYWLSQVNEKLGQWNNDPVSRVYHASPLSWFDWLVGGILLGLGFLSKYPMLLAGFCSLFVLITRTQPRAWVPGFLFHLCVASVLSISCFSLVLV